MEQRIEVFNGEGLLAIDMCIMNLKEFSAPQAEQGWFIHDTSTISWVDNQGQHQAKMVVIYRRKA